MNFSLDWFLSIPGLLITGGVLLLFIALIILIVTGKKKKEDVSASTETTTTAPVQNETATVAPTATPTNGAVPEMNSPALSTGTIMDIPAPVGTGPMVDANANMNMNMGVNNAMPTAEVSPVNPMVAPTVQATPEMAPTMQTPAVEPVAPVMETPAAPAVEPIAPVMETPVAPVAPEPVVQQPAQAEPVIYGGANPIVPEINIPETQHQIYGGANPLENTQSIPISNLVGQNQQTVVQTPTPEPTIVVEQQPPVAGQPTNIGQ